MSAAAWRLLVGLELRLRLRRGGSLATLLTVMALGWLMIADPASGRTLLVVRQARVLYTSATLALGSAALAAMLFSLAGFYLLRGRMAEDLRSGAGGVIAATGCGNAAFLLSRWLGGLLYLGALALALMLSIMVMQLLRGDGAVAPAVYLSTYAVVLLPVLVFCSSWALLFDSVGALMGKAGDLLYFLLWMGALGLLAVYEQAPAGPLPLSLLFDFSGLGTAVMTLERLLQLHSIALGRNAFDAALPALAMPAPEWPLRLVLLRAGAALLAALPLLPAVLLFHRFSPDRVQAGQARRRRSPLAWADARLRPLSRLVQPLFGVAPRLPGVLGQAAADTALTLAAAPSAILLLLLAWLGGALLPAPQLAPLLVGAVLVWALLVSDISTRDVACASEALGAGVAGGAVGRYWRQLLATVALGLLFMGPVAARWLAGSEPLRALVLLSGVCCLGAAAQLCGRCARTPRLFTALFLFGLYLALSARGLPALDMVGFNGSATSRSAMQQSLAALLALAAGLLHARWRAARA